MAQAHIVLQVDKAAIKAVTDDVLLLTEALLAAFPEAGPLLRARYRAMGSLVEVDLGGPHDLTLKLVPAASLLALLADLRSGAFRAEVLRAVAREYSDE